ncbi:hypothetical protein [Modestobacter sp. URMC 112]
MLAAVLLAGCTGEAAGTAVVSTGSPASSSVEASSTTPPAAADPTTGGADDGTTGEATADDGGSDDGRSDSGSPVPEGPGSPPPGGGGPGDEIPDGGTEGLPGWPIESVPVHGADYWAAYLAVGEPGDPALQRVLSDVQQLWPGAMIGELGCDEGAAEALGRDSTDHAVAVYFATEEHLTEFRRRWDSPWVASVRVVTFCGD